MASVTLNNLCKIYPGDVRAVDNINLEIQDREFLVLVGPSGCGKSTTLRMIAGLEDISEGSIKIGDRVVNDVPPKDRDIAMVFQNYALYPHMTVYKNMAFGLELRKFKKEEIDKRVRDAAKILSIENFLDRKPKAMSGGQRQRVAVGRAIVRKPQVFLFDEPLSNLDAKLRVQMRVEISKLHARLQSTMVYVTHDQIEAMTMGDRIVVMKDGVIQQCADPITLYDHPVNKFVAGFIGTPPMNFFDGTVDERDGKLFFKEESLEFQIPGPVAEKLKAEKVTNGPITLGVRPEDFYDPTEQVNDATVHEFKSQVEIIEPMGSELYLYLTTGKNPFVARVGPHIQAGIDDEKPLLINLDKIHFFHHETEATLT